MGIYTTGEFLELFGGLPDPGDRQHARDHRDIADREDDVDADLNADPPRPPARGTIRAEEGERGYRPDPSEYL